MHLGTASGHSKYWGFCWLFVIGFGVGFFVWGFFGLVFGLVWNFFLVNLRIETFWSGSVFLV